MYIKKFIGLLISSLVSAPYVMAEQGNTVSPSYMDKMQTQGEVGLAQHAQPINARLAKAGEILTPLFAQKSAPQKATAGDWVVDYACPQREYSQQLLNETQFSQHYEAFGINGVKPGFIRAVSRQPPVNFWVIPKENRHFHLASAVLREGDVIIRSIQEPEKLYAISAAQFQCWFQVITIPQHENRAKQIGIEE